MNDVVFNAADAARIARVVRAAERPGHVRQLPSGNITPYARGGGLCLSETNGKPTDIPPTGCKLRIDPATYIEWLWSPTVNDWIGYCPCIIPGGTGSTGSAGSGTVQTACCANLLPVTLCMSVVPGSDSPSCLGGNFTITYSATQGGWFLSLPAGSPCSHSMTYLFSCVGGTFGLNVTCNGQPALLLSGPLVCSPIYWYSSSGGGGIGFSSCFGAGEHSGVSVTITECASGGGGGGGGGGGVTTACCPSNPVPQTLHGTFSGGSTYTASLDGVAVTFTWVSGANWTCSFVWQGATQILTLTCSGSDWTITGNNTTGPAITGATNFTATCSHFTALAPMDTLDSSGNPGTITLSISA